MNQDTRNFAASGSYPTFWDKPAESCPSGPIAPDQAYSEFVNHIEDALHDGAARHQPLSSTIND